MMALEPKQKLPLPVITSNDYDAFVGVLGSHIPDTYDKWLDLFAEWKKEWSRNGASVRRVNVNASEFSEYLAATGHAPTLNELFVFAAGFAHDD